MYIYHHSLPSEQENTIPSTGSFMTDVLLSVWRPQFIKDIKVIDRVQRRATKFILDDYRSDYKSHMTSLNMLSLMMQFELNDICELSKEPN